MIFLQAHKKSPFPKYLIPQACMSIVFACGVKSDTLHLLLQLVINLFSPHFRSSPALNQVCGVKVFEMSHVDIS